MRAGKKICNQRLVKVCSFDFSAERKDCVLVRVASTFSRRDTISVGFVAFAMIRPAERDISLYERVI